MVQREVVMVYWQLEQSYCTREDSLEYKLWVAFCGNDDLKTECELVRYRTERGSAGC